MRDKKYQMMTDYSADTVSKMSEVVRSKVKPLVRRIRNLYDNGTEKDYAEYTRKRKELDSAARELSELRGTAGHNTRTVISGIDTHKDAGKGKKK